MENRYFVGYDFSSSLSSQLSLAVNYVGTTLLLFCFLTPCYGLSVSLEWDPALEPDIAGYRVFYRKQGEYFDYSNPAWEGSTAAWTSPALADGNTYYFVVRAYDFVGNESGNSNEVFVSEFESSVGGFLWSDQNFASPLCAMIIANGQYMFSCGEVPGRYRLQVPLDENGQITIFAFADGFEPFTEVLTPSWAANHSNIYMTPALFSNKNIELTAQTSGATSNPNWVRIRGTVSWDGTPLCAMVLANGQRMFTCDENLGIYDFEVPLDYNGEITIFGFCDGFEPYKEIL